MTFYLPDFSLPELPEHEAIHCLKVLRKSKGDTVAVVDGKGNRAVATLLTDNPKKCAVRLDQAIASPKAWKSEIWLAVAPTKQMERMEWMVEKCTEIGVDGIGFIKTDRTERSFLKQERLEKVAISAMKQSGQAWLPQLAWYDRISDFPSHGFDQSFIGDLSGHSVAMHSLPEGKYVLWIGPEGDFTVDELEDLKSQNVKGIRFVPQVLRTETAAVFGLSLLRIASGI